MRYYSILSEVTADDLFRKLDAINASLNDKVPTANEKENLQKAKDKIERRLKTEFPNAKPPVNKAGSLDQARAAKNQWDSTWGAAMDAHDKYEKARTGTAADKEPYMRDIERMKAKRKKLKVLAGMGNVEASRDMKNLTSRINRIYRDIFPDEWAKMERAREKARDASYERERKKRSKKQAADSDAASKSGLSTKKAAKMYPELGVKLHKLMELPKSYSVKSILDYMIPGSFGPSISKLKSIAKQLTPEELAQLREMVSAVHDKGYIENNEGMTPAQKEKFLSAITPEHTGPTDSKDAITFPEFKEKFEPIIAKVKYRHDKWTKGKSIFDLYGQSMSAYDKREAIEKINKRLSKKERQLLVAQLKNVAPANKVEAARVKKLIALLETK